MSELGSIATVLELVQSMNRAKQTGQTSTQELKLKKLKELYDQVDDLCSAAIVDYDSSGTAPDVNEVLNVLLTIVAYQIAVSFKDNKLAGLLKLSLLASFMLDQYESCLK